MLAATTMTPAESWLPLLCWRSDQAEKLASIVRGDVFELHPVSGEIDFGDVQSVEYKRFDEDTLQANIKLLDLGLCVTYLWILGDQEGGENGWRVSEVLPLEDQKSSSMGWFFSITEADEEQEKIQTGSSRNGIGPGHSASYIQGEDGNHDATHIIEEEEDESYWAQYATTPRRSPGRKHSPWATRNSEGRHYQKNTSDDEYYARYAQIQPEIENDDPSEDHSDLGESNLNGNILHIAKGKHVACSQASSPAQLLQPEDAGINWEVSCRDVSSPSSRSAVPRLEDSAEVQSASEVAIRQHVSTCIKSLFRLMRGAGIDREEFNDLIRRELDTLSLIADDD
jgi:hypothetical protein